VVALVTSPLSRVQVHPILTSLSTLCIRYLTDILLILHSVRVLYFTNCAVTGGFSFVRRMASPAAGAVIATDCSVQHSKSCSVLLIYLCLLDVVCLRGTLWLFRQLAPLILFQ
jgi:hypothetical protein